MINPDILDYRLLTGLELAAMVRQSRSERGWTQETLAELAQVAVRTVQRLEEGQPSSVDTRRAIAGALEFENLDIFSKPWPLPNIEKLKEEMARIERETVEVVVQRLTKGRQLRELADQADSYLVTSIDEPARDIEAHIASLQEFFGEYGDCHDLYSPTDKLGIDGSFQEWIDELGAKGVGLIGGTRRVRMRFDHLKPDDPGVVFEVAYVVSGPAEALPKSIRVPRKGRFGF